MKKLFSLLLTAAMVCSLAVTAGAADVVPISASANGTAAPVAAPAPDLTGSTVILHTNDVHGAIAGYAKVAALKQYYQDCRRRQQPIQNQQKTDAARYRCMQAGIQRLYKKKHK